MGFPTARIGDLTAHGTTLAPGPGSANVSIGDMPAWRAQKDQHTCPLLTVVVPHGAGPVIIGSPTVYINNMMAVTKGDQVVEPVGGPNSISRGLVTVLISKAGIIGSPGELAVLSARQTTGSCTLMSINQIYRQATGNNLTEAQLIAIAEELGIWNPPDGGTDWGGGEDMLDHLGVPAHTEENNVENIANALAMGKGVTADVNAGTLWDGDPSVPNPGDYSDDYHTVRVTGVERDENGDISNVIINDTGTGPAPTGTTERSVPADQFQRAQDQATARGGVATVTDNPL